MSLVCLFLMVAVSAVAEPNKSPSSFIQVTVGIGSEPQNDAEKLVGNGLSQSRIDSLLHQNLLLRERLKVLELAVVQLQHIISQSRLGRDVSIAHYTCMLRTSFNGTFKGRGETKVEAIADTLQKCDATGANAIWCDANDVKCERI